MPTLSKAAAAASVALTQAFKTQQNREAAKVAAALALYYSTRVDPTSADSVEAWLDLMIPHLIKSSDDSATRAAVFFDAIRRLEAGDVPAYAAEPSLGVIDSGVRKSLLAVGPYDYVNKARKIETTEGLSPTQQKAMIAEARSITTKKLAQTAVRHAQAGGRQTIDDNATRDKVAIGWVRVTRAKPCYFCAMLASRGLQYRPYKEGAFDMSNARFSGDGDAKVHDECGCAFKPVYTENDPVLQGNGKFVDMWSRWGAGGGTDAALRFRRGYDHWSKTGEYLDADQVEAA